MPILPPEPFAYPANPFELAPEFVQTDASWLVMHTRSRAEKALARCLLSDSIPFFLPVYKKTIRVNGRDQTSYPPLFPGYVFVWGDADARYRALATNQVASCLPVHNQKELATDLSNVYHLMTEERSVAPVERIPLGAPVEVIEGPFAGMTGKLLRNGSQTRFIVEVRMINQGVAIELAHWAVRPITEGGQAERARLALIRR